MTSLRPRRERGVAAVEAALVLSVLVAIVFGITEIGRAMYQYEALTKSARAAARYLGTRTPSDPAVQTAAKCLAVYGVASSPCTGGAPVVPGLTLANVVVDEASANPGLRQVKTADGGASIDLVTVTLSPAQAPYRFESIVPFVFPSVNFGPISAAMPQVYF